MSEFLTPIKTITPSLHPAYRPDIDGLRAVAIVSVVIFHAFPDMLPGGFVGVDIFFVISGFLISSIIFKELDADTFSFANFYARRIKRIFPALLVVLSVCLLFGWLNLLSDEYKQLGKHVASGSAFIANFVLKREAGYFDVSTDLKPLLHLWSLGIEEQFYIVWPLLLVIAHRFNFKNLKAILLLAFVSFTLNVYRVNSNVTSAFYLPQTRFWELLIGSILAYLSLYKNKSSTSSVNNLKAIVGALLIILAISFIDKNKMFPGWWALLPTLGAFLLISAGAKAWINRYILANRATVFIGLISYPLYLWHWPILAFSRIIEPDELGLTLKLICVVSSFILAWLTYTVIERYFRKKTNQVALYLFFVGCLIAGAGYLSYLEKIKPRSSQYPFDKIINATGEWDYPGNLKKFNFQGKTFWQQGQSSKKVLFFGDSNIEQYYPRFNSLLRNNPSKIKSIIFATGGGCPPLPKVSDVAHPRCNGLVDATLSLAKNGDIDTIVIGAQWSSYFNKKTTRTYDDGNFSGTIQLGSEAFNKAMNELEFILKNFRLMGKKVYLVLNIPVGKGVAPKAMINRSWFGDFSLRTSQFDKTGFLSENKAIYDGLRRVATASGAILIDPMAYLCDALSCPTMESNGEPIYKDRSHLRPSYVKEHVLFLDETVLIHE